MSQHTPLSRADRAAAFASMVMLVLIGGIILAAYIKAGA